MALRVFVAGHKGLVGSAIVRALQGEEGVTILQRDRQSLDLAQGAAVRQFLADERPDVVFLAAAKVGGIHANATAPWDFLYDNLRIETSVLGAALEYRIPRVIFFGSSCIYPKLAPQPMREEYLLTGTLEPTNEPYAIAKIAGLKLVEAANRQYGTQWVSLMPTNLYGPNDNFDLERSHVLPALIRRFHEAKLTNAPSVTLWGDGTPYREFLHVDDLARAAISFMRNDMTGLYNVGYGSDITIRDLAKLIADIVEYTGEIAWDTTRPNGTPRKLLDSSRIQATGWRPTIELAAGIRATYEWFLEHQQVYSH
jgi:GDP-L-fucose synthase